MFPSVVERDQSIIFPGEPFPDSTQDEHALRHEGRLPDMGLDGVLKIVRRPFEVNGLSRCWVLEPTFGTRSTGCASRDCERNAESSRAWPMLAPFRIPDSRLAKELIARNVGLLVPNHDPTSMTIGVTERSDDNAFMSLGARCRWRNN